MEDNKRYKATDIKVDGPFDGWIIEELTEEEMEKEDARKKELEAQQPKKPASGAPQKLSPEELQKKRDEQLNKIKELINQKRKEKLEANKGQAQSQNQAQPQAQPKVQPQAMTRGESEAVSPSLRQEEDLEAMLIRKSKETGIPVEVLRMIEEKKKELRERKKNQGNPNGGGVEMYDTVKARREREEAEKYYEEHQVRKPVRKAPNGEEIGDRETIMPEEKSHDLYNVMDDVGLDEDR